MKPIRKHDAPPNSVFQLIGIWGSQCNMPEKERARGRESTRESRWDNREALRQFCVERVSSVRLMWLQVWTALPLYCTFPGICLPHPNVGGIIYGIFRPCIFAMQARFTLTSAGLRVNWNEWKRIHKAVAVCLEWFRSGRRRRRIGSEVECPRAIHLENSMDGIERTGAHWIDGQQ